MRYNKLGNSELELTPIGIGTWALGGADWQYGWGAQDDELSIKTIYRAIDLGINWIDTAPVYGLGHSEEVVSKALKGLSPRPIVATKCSRLWDGNREIYSSLRRESIFQEVDDSLRRLDVDVIDLLQIHWPHPKEEVEEGWDAVARLIDKGKVRYGGVCNYSPKQMERILPIGPITSCQPPYSMLRRQSEYDVLPFCAEHNIGVVSYGPMTKGLLTGKVTQERAAGFADDDHRRNDPMFQEPELSVNIVLAEKLVSLAESYGHTASQLAIAWVLRRPEVTSAIVGARRPDQIEETILAADWALTESDIQQVETWLTERQEVLRGMADKDV